MDDGVTGLLGAIVASHVGQEYKRVSDTVTAQNQKEKAATVLEITVNTACASDIPVRV